MVSSFAVLKSLEILLGVRRAVWPARVTYPKPYANRRCQRERAKKEGLGIRSSRTRGGNGLV